MGETVASVLLVRLVDPNLALIIYSKVGAGSNLVVEDGTADQQVLGSNPPMR